MFAARPRPLLLTAVLVAAPLVFSAPGPASAAGQVGFGTVEDAVADVARGRVFVSLRQGQLAVTDLAGVPLATVSGFGTATGLAVTPDGASLWVADAGRDSTGTGSALVRVDTASLAVVQRIDLPPGTCPGDVAVAGTRLAYAFSCAGYQPVVFGGDWYDAYAPYAGSSREEAALTYPSTPTGGLGVVDTATGELLGTSTTGPVYRPGVEPAGAGRFYATDVVTGTTLELWEATGTGPARVATTALPCVATDLAATTDGARAVTTCGDRRDVWTSTLSPSGTGSGPAAAGAAWSADGRTLAVGGDAAGADVGLHVDGAATPSRSHDLGAEEGLVEYGLAASPDGSRAWAVTWVRGLGLVVRELSFAATSTTLTATADPAPDGGATTLSGRLTSGELPVAGARIDLVPDDGESLPSAVTDADGRWSQQVTLTATGASQVRAVYVGEGAHQTAAATAPLTVTAPTPASTSLTVSAPATGVVDGPVTVSGTLTSGGAGVDGRVVSLARSGCGTTTPSWSTTTGGGGGFSVTDSPSAGSCLYTATFAGDAGYAASTGSATVSVAKRTTELTVSAVRTDRRTVHVTAYLGATGTNRVVTITARATSGGSTTTLASAEVDADGYLRVKHSTRATTSYTAGFSGDSESLAATATATA